jgi:exosome complex component RRP4
MRSGHRSGPRGRTREGVPSHGSSPKTLVLPGEEIPAQGLKPGPGTYRVGGHIYASILGLLQHRPPLVRVVALSGRYIPKPNDVVIGTVTDVQGTFWLLDIGAPRWAPLHMTGTPWKMDFGETGQYLQVGDSVVVSVETLESTGRIGVTMNGEGLGKLDGGVIVTISPAKVPRVIGKGGSMVSMITEFTATKIAVGQNGRIWIDGPEDGIRRARDCLRIIDEEGQRSGLTERIRGFLASTADTDEFGPKLPRPRFEPESGGRRASAREEPPAGPPPHRTDLTDGAAPPPEPEEEPTDFPPEQE